MTAIALHKDPSSVIRATAPVLAQGAEQAELVFTARLRHYAPALAADPAVFSDLAQQVLDTLTTAAWHGERADQSRPALDALALRLRLNGMSPRGYIAVHAALMDMIADRLGTSPAVEKAWADAFGSMLRAMLSKAHGPRSHVMPLAA